MDKIIVCASQRQKTSSVLCTSKNKIDIKNNRTYTCLCIAIGAFKSGTIGNMYAVVDELPMHV